jgi:hypothetical protein
VACKWLATKGRPAQARENGRSSDAVLTADKAGAVIASLKGTGIMSRTRILLAVGLALLPVVSYGDESAQVTLFCWSLRFNQGHGSFDETLDLSTTSGTPNEKR